MTADQGYYRSPTLHQGRIVFVCESDLWTVPAAGGQARRLTANYANVGTPVLSPDGQWLAFAGCEEGGLEVYVMPASGGLPRRLTYLGSPCLVAGWSPDGARILIATRAEQPMRHGLRLWSVPRSGGPPELLPYGPADRIAHGPGGAVVLGRNVGDPARWKRYRGGRTGDLWVDAEGGGSFRRLLALPGNLADPMWIGDRVHFLSDHEGHGNVYSCTPEGDDLRRLTHHEEFYARNARSDGRRIVYQSGAELYLLDPQAAGGAQKLDVRVASAKPQLVRRFASAADYMEEYDPHPKGHSLALISRGKLFTMGNWEGNVAQRGERDGVRYRLGAWLHEGKRLVCVSDAGGEEALEVHDARPALSGEESVRRLEGLDIGRPIDLVASPTKDEVVLTNHRHELVWVDLGAGAAKVLDKSPFGRIEGAAWSPDGRWVAYGFPGTQRTCHLRLVRVESGEVHDLTRPVHVDVNPWFDPQGKFVAFVSYRTFDPVYDKVYFDLGFPKAGGICLVTLQKDTPSPLRPPPRTLDGDEAKDPRLEDADEKGKQGKKKGKKKDEQAKAQSKKDKKGKKGKKKDKKGKKKDKKVEEVKIDLDGLEGRVIALPVPEGIYGSVAVVKDKVLYDRSPVQGALGHRSDDDGPQGELCCFDLEKQKEETWVSGISSCTVAMDAKTLVYSTRSRLRVVKAESKPDDGKDEVGRSTGWVSLSRPRVSVVPSAEWRQMYREAWRLQRDHFWTPTLANVDWQGVYERYLPVLERVATRAEFSDLMWEVQGELGTSHAYEFGGDHPRRPPPHRPGLLGADLRPEGDGWIIERLVEGDSWVETATSPLCAPGLDVRPGDRILSIDGRRLTTAETPGELLDHRAGTEVEVVVKRKGEEPRPLTIKTLSDESDARYRAWVEANRRRVHEASEGRLGYLHVPDMGARGFSEFHRYYMAEALRPGLVVDVRYNGGGHVSQILLEKLARRRLGYDVSRWGQPDPYPMDSVLGPIVCLTNEHAGSDGDIFSHCFKLMKLGPLVGKRTWGGVVGIWPRHPLVDRTVTTQAEFAFWFEDVGFGVENYGTEPDVDVDIAPQDWAAGDDPQLSKGIELALATLEETQPKVPDFGPVPDLRPPRLSS